MLCALSSCRALYPDTREKDAAILPQTYSSQSAGNAVVSNGWWLSFDNEELDRLMDVAFAGNLTLAQAGARLRQASALARKTGAAAFPQISGEASASVARRHTENDSETADDTIESYGIGIAASYEVDLWGRVRSSRLSAELAAGASRLDLESAAMSLAAQVADRWLQLVEARAEKALVARQIEINKAMLDLLKVRLGKSSTRLLDIYQQEQALRSAEAVLPPVEQRIELLCNEIAVLAGLPPGAPLRLDASVLPALPPGPDAGVPADILVQRPDVTGELLRLRAAGWDVAAARADRLPALRLSGGAAYGADSMSDVLKNWSANLAAGLTAPLFDGGRRRAEVERTTAKLDEQLAKYRQTVLSAMLEVEDALIRERRLKELHARLLLELESASKALDEAQRRYLKGAADHLSVLAALNSVQRLERTVLVAERVILSNRVALVRALGGSWANDAAAAWAARRDILSGSELTSGASM